MARGDERAKSNSDHRTVGLEEAVLTEHLNFGVRACCGQAKSRIQISDVLTIIGLSAVAEHRSFLAVVGLWRMSSFEVVRETITVSGGVIR